MNTDPKTPSMPFPDTEPRPLLDEELDLAGGGEDTPNW